MVKQTGIVLLVLFFSTKLLAQEPASMPSGSYKPVTGSQLLARSEVVAAAPLLPCPERSVIFGSVEFGLTKAGATVEKSISFKGARPGHTVSVFIPRGARVAGAHFDAYVLENDKVTLRYTNSSSQAQNPGGIQTFRIAVHQ